MDLQGKRALVTGAGRGIGRGCAMELAKRGADIVLNDRPGSADLQTTVEAIRDLGRQCEGIEADVFSRAGCEQLIEETRSIADAFDIFISNPAYSVRGSFLEYSPEEFERTVNGTLAGGFHMAQLVARAMVARGQGGKIVFISSVQAELPMARCFAYGAAKAGLNHMMRSIAVELAPHRINVNAIEPGWIDTDGERESFGSERIVTEGPRLPWGRLGMPDEIGKAAAFLSSPDAEYVTGSVLPVDGLFRFRECVPDAIIKSKNE